MRHIRRITTQAPSTLAITTPLSAIIKALMSSTSPKTIATTAEVHHVATIAMPIVTSVDAKTPTTWGVVHQIALEMLVMC